MANATGGPGFFGKLPCVGDFVRRRLPDAFLARWDPHFEQALAASRNLFGESWQARFSSSPVWRFALPADVCGETACVGVMGPSRDRVGRLAPLVIAAMLPPASENTTKALIDGGRWFATASRLVHGVAADRYPDIECFEAEVAALADPLTPLGRPVDDDPAGFDLGSYAHWRLPLPEADGRILADWWRRLAVPTRNGCLWWTAGSTRVPPCLLVTSGLPHPAAYAAFLDATQGQDAWRSRGYLMGQDGNSVPEPLADASNPFPPSAAPGETPLLRLPPDGDVPGFAAPDGPGLHGKDRMRPVEPDSRETIALLRRLDCGLTVLAAQCARSDARQQGLAQVRAIVNDLDSGAFSADPGMLRRRLLESHPRLSSASESLVDPVAEDCAVLAVRFTAKRAMLLCIGEGAAWLWRAGSLQSCFPPVVRPARVEDDATDDLGDLLSAPVQRGGLGSGSRLICEETTCDLIPGDRLLLLSTPAALRLEPTMLARALGESDCGKACARIAATAGLSETPERWPLTIVELPQ